MSSHSSKQIRNIAIIAHVDHGKTTVVDELLQQSGTLSTVDKDRVMDFDVLEKERGITILAKNTGVVYNEHTINIVDTPGHADFGGEVERTLQMVEGFLLLVDAAEGVLPGTRFVLQKALELNLKPIVLINKIDRKDAKINETEEEIHDLFLDLVTHEDQLDFSILYGSGKNGFVSTDPQATSGNMEPLFETIIKTIPSPPEQKEPLQLLVTSLGHSDFLGALVIGRVFSGSLSIGDHIVICKDDFVSKPTKITKIFTFRGLDRVETDKAISGDIVTVAGFDSSPDIGSTLCTPTNIIPRDYVHVDEPTLSMFFSVNNSPFSGKEGTLLTSRNIRERLEKELRTNVALRVEDTSSPEVMKVSGRGQLHLGVLIENMRREGFELQVSAPEVIFKTIDGKKNEPIEQVVVDVPEEYQGVIMETMGIRKGQLKNVSPIHGQRVRLEYKVPSRALLGFRSQMLTDTRGTAVVNIRFVGYEPYKGDIPTRTKGALISMEKGPVTGYSLDGLQARGILFVRPGDEVYAGMIIGEHNRNNDLDVNPCKGKKLTNVRASGSDDAIKLAPPKIMELEECMEWIKPDELIEVTPKSIRLRKKILQASMRKKK
jgi:GTP-binding protein